jgi:serine/threonine-protein kinase HipA
VFLADDAEVPRMIELPALLAASRSVVRGGEDLSAIGLLMAAGSASLGGARPKASIRDGERLSIAKFPHEADQWDVMAWEATALDLASRCGIDTPPHRLETVGDASVLLVERFDRVGVQRVAYISAMTLLDRVDGEDGDYLEVAEILAAHGAQVVRDLQQLWRRVAFSLAVNNTDDHLRNHGFLRAKGGWTLAPVFDVNPNPDPGAHRMTSVIGATDRIGGLRALMASADSFSLRRAEAEATWDEICAVVAEWRRAATANGIRASEQRLFADALDAARSLAV